MSTTVSAIVTALVALAGVGVLGILAWLGLPLRRPLRTESDYSHHLTPFWELYYSHKYLWPRLEPERGAGLEEHFRSQRFLFEPAATEPCEVSIRAVGDLMIRSDLDGPAGEKLWSDIGEVLFGADLSSGNLEFSINEDWHIMTTFRFSVPARWARPLLGDEGHGRFDYLSLANNHINDSLSSGISRTREFLEEEGIATSGASRTLAERDEFPILERGGARIALLAYTFSTTGIPLERGQEHGVNLVRFNAIREADYDDALIRHHVALARERGANYIVANHHWCIDYEAYPPRRIVERTHRLLEAGVDLIVGHHPHIIGPVECYRARDGRQCLVFYSLGSLTTRNLYFSWQRLSLIGEVMLSVEEVNGGRRVRPAGVAVRPVYHLTQGRGARRAHRLLPVVETLRRHEAGESMPHLSRGTLRALHKSLKLTRKVVGSQGLEIL